MSAVVKSLRGDFPGSGKVPIHAPNYRPTLGVVILIVAGVFSAIPAIFDQNLGFRLVMGTLALFGIVAGLSARMWSESVTASVVRLDARKRGLRFVSALGVRWIFTAWAVLALLPTVIAFIFELRGEPVPMATWGRFGVYGVGIVALGWLLQQLWSMRLPVGLELIPEGLFGVRGGPHVAILWDELLDVSVISKRGAKLVLRAAGGAVHTIEPRWTGSDPNVVAAIIEHYRKHPSDRESLTGDPHAAINRVDQVAQATQGRQNKGS